MLAGFKLSAHTRRHAQAHTSTRAHTNSDQSPALFWAPEKTIHSFALPERLTSLQPPSPPVCSKSRRPSHASMSRFSAAGKNPRVCRDSVTELIRPRESVSIVSLCPVGRVGSANAPMFAAAVRLQAPGRGLFGDIVLLAVSISFSSERGDMRQKPSSGFSDTEFFASSVTGGPKNRISLNISNLSGLLAVAEGFVPGGLCSGLWSPCSSAESWWVLRRTDLCGRGLDCRMPLEGLMQFCMIPVSLHQSGL